TWHSNSPDLNPMDYYMYGKLERHACATSHANVTSIKASIKRQASKLPAADVTAACKAFRSRIEVIITAEGRHIESN
ncbi:Uncharacterized protein FKW44_021166, partial [Caligus rogercresseyi]